jgi:hypothetical protein
MGDRIPARVSDSTCEEGGTDLGVLSLLAAMLLVGPCTPAVDLVWTLRC